MLLPFERIPSIRVAGISVRPSLVVAALIIGLVAWRSPAAFSPTTWLKKALYLFLFVNLISALLSSHIGRALEVTGFLGFVIALALALSGVAADLDLRRARKYLLIGAGVACAIGLYQFFGDLAGLPASATGLKPAYSGQVFGFPRVQSTALEPLYLANYLLLPIAVVMTGAITAANGLALMGLFLVALLTLSRGGVAATAILTLGLVGIHLKRKQFKESAGIVVALIMAVVVAYALLAYAVPALTHYRQSRVKVVETYTHQLANYEIGNTGVDRAHTRQLALELFKQYPLFGSGPGTYGYYAHAKDPNLPLRQIVNNEPYELLAEVGVVGLGSFALFALLLAWAALKSLWKQSIDAAWTWRLALLGSLMAITIQYWSFSTLYIIHIWVIIGLLVGLTEAHKAEVR